MAKRGRKPMAEGKKDNVTKIRMTDEDIKMLDEVCQKTGKNKSEVIRSSLLLLYYAAIHSDEQEGE